MTARSSCREVLSMAKSRGKAELYSKVRKRLFSASFKMGFSRCFPHEPTKRPRVRKQIKKH